MHLMLALPAVLFLPAVPTQDVSRARSALARAIRDKDPDGARDPVRILRNAGDSTSVRALTSAASSLRQTDDTWWMPVYWSLLAAAASSNDEKGLKELSKFIVRNKRKPVSRDAMAMVCSRGHAGIIPVCVEVLWNGSDDLRLLAAEHLGAVGNRAAFRQSTSG